MLHQSGDLDSFTQVREKERKKKEKEEKGLLRDISVGCFPVGLTFRYILKRKEKRKENCFLSFIIICLVVAYQNFVIF